MVQIIPRAPSFGEEFARALGSGIGQGVSGTSDIVKQLALIKSIESGSASPARKLASEGTSVPLMEEESAEDLFNKAQRYSMAGLKDQADITSQRALAKEKSEFKREAAGEEKALEINERLDREEDTASRFDRLENLFSPELEKKFPNRFGVALFQKDGEINPKQFALLSEEAQESVKLIADQIKGAKDTYGARVTNFDAAQYLKTLPTLLNSPEGRRRILKQLKILNQLNINRDKGILDIMERYGGPRKISISKAQSIYRKENAPEIARLRKEFVDPTPSNAAQLPSAAANKGAVYRDTETGERFVSNGVDWVPENAF